MSIYLESSALLRVILGEEGALAAADRIGKADRVVASRLVQIEAERSLIRIGLDRPHLERMIPVLQRNLGAMWSRVHFFDITQEVCDLAGRVAPASRLRTLDAIHLATFRIARKVDPALEMLTFDERLLREI
jgi:predicted nucleic acid-binding protein